MPNRSEIQFIPVTAPVVDQVTKFGGQPVWHGEPQWPLSRATGKPMRFICQIAIDQALFPGSAGKMAYVFMTDEEHDYIDGTWEADGGENAVIIQPSNEAPSVATVLLPTGPTLHDLVHMPGKERAEFIEREYLGKLTPGSEPAYVPEEDRAAWDDEKMEKYAVALEGSKIGGSPIFLQYDEFPAGGDWRLLMQLDSTNVPFFINFGDAGIAYAFIDQAGRKGKMLWQCS